LVKSSEGVPPAVWVFFVSDADGAFAMVSSRLNQTDMSFENKKSVQGRAYARPPQ
jgi:hypothetical protein